MVVTSQYSAGMVAQTAHRRTVLRAAGLTIAAGVGAGAVGWLAGSSAAQTGAPTSAPAAPPAAPPPGRAGSGDAVLQQLLDGNARYVSGTLRGAYTPESIAAQAQDQSPVALVVSCVDSRVTAEMVFDTNVGDLFVLRGMGSVVGETELAVAGYAAENYDVGLMLVLGHERCLGLALAAEAARTGQRPDGPLGDLIGEITPAVTSVYGSKVPADAGTADEVLAAHVTAMADRIRDADWAAPLVAAGKLRVVGARYDLDDGSVRHLSG